MQARVDSAPLTSSSGAVSVNYNWLRRDVDHVLQPTNGAALSLQAGVGYGDGRQKQSNLADEKTSRGPFVRTYALHLVPPIRRLVRQRTRRSRPGVRARLDRSPDTILYRAGGDNSVRGYDYCTLGPLVNGAVVGGRVLATASLEVEHSLSERPPSPLGAVFVDAGNAADGWRDLRPVFGCRVGLHHRSPVGPLRLDVAYADRDQRSSSFNVGDLLSRAMVDDPAPIPCRRRPAPTLALRPPRRALWRWLGGTLATLVVVVVMLIGALLWALRSPYGTAWLLSWAPQLSVVAPRDR